MSTALFLQHCQEGNLTFRPVYLQVAVSNRLFITKILVHLNDMPELVITNKSIRIVTPELRL